VTYTEFDRAAPSFGEGRAFPEHVGEELCMRVMEATACTPESRFLEIGIGTGRVALPLLRAGVRYTGIDLSAAMLARCFESIVAEGLTALLVLGDATNMAFDDGSFDVLIAANVFRAIRDRRAAVNEMLRVVRRPGNVVLVTHVVVEGSIEDVLGRRKRDLIRARGEGTSSRRGDETLQAVQLLQEAGGLPSVFRTRGWGQRVSPRSFIQRSARGRSVTGRPWASQLTAELEHEALSRYGSLDTEEEDTRHLEITVIRIP
jgi:SAM-dependent methyltransferase